MDYTRTIEIPVTTYVRRFLFAKYGEGPYDLSNRNELRVSFLVFDTTCDPLIRESTLQPLETIHVLPDRTIEAYFFRWKRLFEKGAFYYYEFFQSMLIEVQSRQAIAQEFGIFNFEVSRKRSLYYFLQRYGISEDEYGLDTAYRQLQRIIDRSNTVLPTPSACA